MADASMTLTDWKERAMRMGNQLKNIKLDFEATTERALISGLGYMGNGLAGAMRGRWGKGSDRHVYISGTEIEFDALVGTIGSLLSVVGIFGKFSGAATGFFTGLGGYAFGRTVEEKVAAAQAKAAHK
jgi:hypothetical protein